MVSSQTGMEQQNLLSEPFFQEIMNDLEDPINEETLLNQERRYKGGKLPPIPLFCNIIYVYLKNLEWTFFLFSIPPLIFLSVTFLKNFKLA